jgi:hypothetical protein
MRLPASSEVVGKSVMTDKKQSPGATGAPTKVQGEGDYVAGRRFQEAERSFVQKADVEAGAREAAESLEGPEGEDLEAARKSTGEGKIPTAAPGDTADASDPHEEQRLDSGLDETFPASDPVSISRGAD